MYHIGAKAGYSDLNDDYYRGMAEVLNFLEFAAAGFVDSNSIDTHGLSVKAVHVSHYGDRNTNPMDSRLLQHNRTELARAIAIADYFSAEYIVVHPERKFSSSCSMDSFRFLISSVPDSRYCLENMPTKPEGDFFGQQPEELEYMARGLEIGYCLDIGHVACHAGMMKCDFEKYLRSLLVLQPRYFHFSDNHALRETNPIFEDAHLHLGEGSIDWELVVSLLPSDVTVTFETPPDFEGRQREAEMIRKLAKKT